LLLRIAIFDYKIVRTNPVGGCHLRMLRALATEHEFTVFAVEFDNPCPEKINWIRIPVPTRPLALLFVTYHALAPLLYVLHRLWTGSRFDLIQMVESNLSFGGISYSHFCHRAYLKYHWQKSHAKGLRGHFRWLDHFLHACFEGFIYKHAKQILVPSRGLARELEQEFPFAANKIRVLPNAVDIELFQRPTSFDRREFRRMLDLDDDDIVFLFVALGQFERKGLPLLMDALRRLRSEKAKVIVVGGEQDLIEKYRVLVKEKKIDGRMRFVGMQSDVRAFFWAADAFAFPSLYETFSLVAFEAAAACLPLIAPQLNGIEEIIEDGENGIVVQCTVEEITSGLERFLDLPQELRERMGALAHLAATPYSEVRFISNWQGLYSQWISQIALGRLTPPEVSSSS
jgi:glycosyltransferase involved in cell wall biosynthesis